MMLITKGCITHAVEKVFAFVEITDYMNVTRQQQSKNVLQLNKMVVFLQVRNARMYTYYINNQISLLKWR